ncbi:MAG TPA: hypothetical protein VGF75_00465 [Candidatus Saccharimonadales bacterium]|jgi:hypothetical protein
MPFKYNMDAEKLRRPEPIPQNIYTLRLTGFKPKKSKDGESVNFNPQFTIIDPGQKWDGKVEKYLFVGSAKVPSLLQDMVHALGEIMEQDPNDPDSPASIPGIWDADQVKFQADDPSTWVYQGPLMNKECKAELYINSYQGQDNNRILRFLCAIPDCATKFPKIQHSTNMNWGDK